MISVGHMPSDAEIETVIEDVQAQIKENSWRDTSIRLSGGTDNILVGWKFRKIDGRILEVNDQSTPSNWSGVEDRRNSLLLIKRLMSNWPVKKLSLGKWNPSLWVSISRKIRLTIKSNGKTFMIPSKTRLQFYPGNSLNPDLFQHQMGTYLVLPDLNQLGLKVDKNLEFSNTAKIKDSKILFLAWSKSCIRQTKSVNMMRLILVDLIDIIIERLAWNSRDSSIYRDFLSVIFLLATVLVIYYKQISEGYEGSENFVILQVSRIGPKSKRPPPFANKFSPSFPSFIFSFLYLG